jgi:hypothetical protein
MLIAAPSNKFRSRIRLPTSSSQLVQLVRSATDGVPRCSSHFFFLPDDSRMGSVAERCGGVVGPAIPLYVCQRALHQVSGVNGCAPDDVGIRLLQGAGAVQGRSERVRGRCCGR